MPSLEELTGAAPRVIFFLIHPTTSSASLKSAAIHQSALESSAVPAAVSSSKSINTIAISSRYLAGSHSSIQTILGKGSERRVKLRDC
jgi:hypothetical protein